MSSSSSSSSRSSFSSEDGEKHKNSDIDEQQESENQNKTATVEECAEPHQQFQNHRTEDEIILFASILKEDHDQEQEINSKTLQNKIDSSDSSDSDHSRIKESQKSPLFQAEQLPDAHQTQITPNETKSLPFTDATTEEQKKYSSNTEPVIGYDRSEKPPKVERGIKTEQDSLPNQDTDTTMQASRPTTAKLSRAHRRRHNEDKPSYSTEALPKRKGNGKQRKANGLQKQFSSASTSSISSVTTFDSSYETTDIKASAELIDYRNRKARELLIHQQLDKQLDKELDRHRSFFERGFRTSPRIGQRFSRQTGSSMRQRRRDSVRSRTKNVNKVNPDAILTSFSPRIKEIDVKRNIKHLVAELAKYHNNEGRVQTSKIGPLVSEKQMPKMLKEQGSQTKHGLSDLDTDQSASDNGTAVMSSSGQSKDERRRNIQVILPTNDDVEDNKQTTDELKPKQKSILKTDLISKENSAAKHVVLAEEDRQNKCQSVRQPSRRRSQKGQPISNMSAHSYLSILLNSLGDSDYVMADDRGQLHRVTLIPAPLKSKISYSKLSTTNDLKSSKKKTTFKNSKEQERKKPLKQDSNARHQKADANVRKSKQPRNKQEQLQDGIKTANNEASDNSINAQVGTSPRVRPGTEPIKCNWDPDKLKPEKKEIKCSDHQLKNSGNPAILGWLARKNELVRRERIHKTKENKSKRNKLMQEFNENEDKKEQALIEYEKWKKKKNREILLRRRREALEANNASHKLTENQLGLITETQFHSGRKTSPSKPKDTTITAFSDLRSSATTPQPPTDSLKVGPAKEITRRRPKSAPTKVSFGTPIASHAMPRDNYVPVKINFNTGDVTVLTQHTSSNVVAAVGDGDHQNKRRDNRGGNLSARDSTKKSRSEEAEANFMKKLLDSNEKPKSMFDITSTPSTLSNTNAEKNLEEDKHKVAVKTANSQFSAREHYNNWMRSNGTSSSYQMKLNGKSKKVKKPTQVVADHDPLTNEMLSDLAKRRIKKILDQKKRVDTGLKKKSRETDVQKPSEREIPGDTLKRWMLADNVHVEQITTNNKKTSSEKRPMFSYNRKTKSKSVFHERNPVLNQASNS